MSARTFRYFLLGLLISAGVMSIVMFQFQTITQLRTEGKGFNAGTLSVANGTDGKSAYDIAVDSGFKGSVSEWLVSLATKPIVGSDGADGASAYDIARSTGFNGTVQEWIDSLHGHDATDVTTDQLIQAYSIYCADGKCKGASGTTGATGANGNDGVAGKDADPVVFACVIRKKEIATGVFKHIQYEAWKYSLENPRKYRDQFEIPDNQPCVAPVNLTGEAI